MSRKTAEIGVFVLMPPFARIWEPAPVLAWRADVKKARAMSGLRLVVVLRRPGEAFQCGHDSNR